MKLIFFKQILLSVYEEDWGKPVTKIEQLIQLIIDGRYRYAPIKLAISFPSISRKYIHDWKKFPNDRDSFEWIIHGYWQRIFNE